MHIIWGNKYFYLQNPFICISGKPAVIFINNVIAPDKRGIKVYNFSSLNMLEALLMSTSTYSFCEEIQ